MSLQNRVDPFGELAAVPDRGLHDAGRRVVRQWVGKRWIACAPAFRGRHRRVMSPGRYTELFFPDEATALAAGHRPCAECRRADLLRFEAAWVGGNQAGPVAADAALTDLDAILHAERLTPDRRKIAAGYAPGVHPSAAAG